MEQGDHMVGGERGDQSGRTHGSVGGWGAREIIDEGRREVMVGAGEVMVVAVGSGSRGGECDGEMMMAEGEVRRGYCWEQG